MEQGQKKLNIIHNCKVKKSVRFTSHLIDFAASYGFALTILIIVAIFFPLEIEQLGENSLLDRLITFLLITIYYVVFEYFTQKSLGKIIFGLKVVMIDGTKPELSTLIKRNLSRILGIEALAYLSGSSLWHDNWSDTIVIDEKKLKEMEELDSIGLNTTDEQSV